MANTHPKGRLYGQGRSRGGQFPYIIFIHKI
jgi:hypothetical protein